MGGFVKRSSISALLSSAAIISSIVIAYLLGPIPSAYAQPREEIKLTTIIPDQQVLRVKKGIISTTNYRQADFPDGSIPSQSLIIDEGNVGIGTIAPIARLDISSAARTGTHPAAVKGLYVTGNCGAASDGVEFRHTNATQGIGFGYNSIYAAGTSANQNLNLMPKGTGSVGIGTAAPQAKLHVSGVAGTDGIMFPDGTLQKSAFRTWDSGWVLVTGDARGKVQAFAHDLGAVPEFVQVWVSKTNLSTGGTMFQGDGYGAYGSGDNSACEVNKVTTTVIKIRYAKNDGGGYIVNSFDENKNTWQIYSGNFYVRVVAMKIG